MDIEAVYRGPAGNVAANAINKLNTIFAQRYLNLGGAQIEVKNEAPTAGGEIRKMMLHIGRCFSGRPRTLWTLEAVRNAVQKCGWCA